MEEVRLRRFCRPEEISPEVDEQLSMLNFGTNGQMLAAYVLWICEPEQWPAQVLAVMQGQKVLGWMLAFPENGGAQWAVLVFVDEHHRRRGYATRLLTAFALEPGPFRKGELRVWDRRSRALAVRVTREAPGRILIRNQQLSRARLQHPPSKR